MARMGRALAVGGAAALAYLMGSEAARRSPVSLGAVAVAGIAGAAAMAVPVAQVRARVNAAHGRIDALLPTVGGMKDRTDPLWTNNSFMQYKQSETTGGQLGYGHPAAPGTTYSQGYFNGMVNIISDLQDCHSNTDSACHSAIQRINQILGVLSQAGLMQSNGGP